MGMDGAVPGVDWGMSRKAGDAGNGLGGCWGVAGE